MSAVSLIEWTDRTWNPVTGCTKVSQGCKHCYAEVIAGWFFASEYPTVPIGPELPDGAPTGWRDRSFTDVQTHPERLLEPLRWKKPARVFVNSMSDLFHEAVPDAFIDQVFAVVALASRHTFQVLTKRPQRMREYLADPQRREAVSWQITRIMAGWPTEYDLRDKVASGDCWPLQNVWIGVSVEDQQTADARIPLLLDTPATLRFISYEPALGPLDLDAIGKTSDSDPGFSALTCTDDDEGTLGDAVLDWVIVGGERGCGARPFDIAWARRTVEQCRAAGVAVFVKQMGANSHGYRPDARVFTEALVQVGAFITGKGGDPSEWPEDLRVREFPR